MGTPTEDRGMIFTDDTGKEYCFEQVGLNVWCSHFDGWFAEKEIWKSGEKLYLEGD